MESHWSPERATWTVTVEGAFTLAEVSTLLAERDWQSAKRFVWDLRAASGGPNETQDMQQLSGQLAIDREIWQGCKTGIVVGRDFTFAVARMFQAYADGLGVELEIFRDLEAAMAWVTTGAKPAR